MADHVDALAEGLVEGGVRHAFGVTGSGSSLRLIERLHELGVDYHPAHHEGAAALMAGAVARDGRTRGVSITIKGPGFANALPGMVSNRFEGRPAVSVSEAYGPDTPGHRRHKRMPQHAIADLAVKGAGSVDADAAASVGRWMAHAREEMPGPVHLDLCAEPVATSAPAGTVSAGTGEVARVLDCIAASRRPAVVLGSLATRWSPPGGWGALRVPVTTTAAAKGAYDETLPRAGGVVTGEVTDLSPERGVLAHADLVVGIGLRNDEVVRARPFDAPLVRMDVVDAGAGEGFDAVASATTPDPADGAGRAFAALLDHVWGEDVVADHRTRVAGVVLDGRFLPGPILDDARGALPGDATLVLDTGFFCTVGETVWRARAPEGFCGSSVGRFMGTALPTALGVAVVSPRTPVFCVLGDGGLPPYAPEVSLAVERGLPILFLLLADGRFGSVAAFAPDTPAAHRATDVADPPWWKVMEAMGCEARPVADREGLRTAVASWAPTSGPLFLEARIDPAAHAAVASQLR